MNYNLLLHVDADDPKLLNLAFNNVANYRNALPGKNFEMVLVANGPAAKQFAAPDCAARGRELMDMGLDIRVCANALKVFDVEADRLWAGCRIVPAGVVEIVRLQREGFAYIKP
jgi:intracellular sulfur oxidation DsrE/DsrF family protein